MQCVLVCQLDEEEHGHEHHGVDPHVWLDPQNVIQHVKSITTEISTLDPDHADIYLANSEKYIQELQETDQFIRTSLEKADKNPFIVFHDAYYYFLKAYGLESYQAGTIQEFAGDTPTVKELADLLETIKKSKVKAIFTEPQFSAKVVDTIKAETDVTSMPIDPIG